MEKITRPSLEDIPSLSKYVNILNQYNQECSEGKRVWQSKGNLYKALKNELRNISEGHCSFCDGFPLNDTSRQTIEHYYPKKSFLEKTYEWENLFYCCDNCQSFSYSDNPFRYTLKPDDESYNFEEHFWFDPYDGQLKPLRDDDLNAKLFLKRYGINDRPEKIKARQRRYKELIILLKDEQFSIERVYEAQRYIFDTALKFVKTNI